MVEERAYNPLFREDDASRLSRHLLSIGAQPQGEPRPDTYGAPSRGQDGDDTPYHPTADKQWCGTEKHCIYIRRNTHLQRGSAGATAGIGHAGFGQ